MSEKKLKKSLKHRASMLRRNSNARIALIVVLLAIVVGLFFFWGKFKVLLVVIGLVLMTALGLEASGTDWDLQKLLETRSFEESRVQKTDSGFWVIGDDCSENTYNCDNFEYRDDAQAYFEKCGGGENDVSKLDGDGDGQACESLATR